MIKVKEERSRLLRLTDFCGTVFGTEDFCLFLYSLVRMNGPRTMVELGTGLGISAFWMGLAAKQNGIGHVWTVDDQSLFERQSTLLDQMADFLHHEGIVSVSLATGSDYFDQMAGSLELREFVSFIKAKIDLKEEGHFDHYAFSHQPIDLLFSDFRHSPDNILSILGHFLPRMSPASSIFLDSAATHWPSYMLLEKLVSQLNRGHVAQALQERSNVDLRQVIQNRRIHLLHLTEWKERNQNGTSWLKLEPTDIVPHPRTRMRGL